MSAESAAIERFAELIRDTTGNLMPAARFDFLREVAARRANAAGLRTPGEYVRALAAGELAREWQSLVPLLTIKESYFFRAPQQFEVIERQLLPRLLRARAASRRLRVWSAACARGEEPATVAMLLAEQPELAGWDWSILGTDLDEEALAGARRGLYGERAVALVPPALLARWFTRRGKLYELAPELRARIDYRTLNLAEPPFALPETEYDLVLLRNVLIYFPRQLQSWTVAHVARLLGRRGALFLGASETLWQIQDELEAVDLGSCFCYRHRRARPAPRPAAALPSAARPKAPPEPRLQPPESRSQPLEPRSQPPEPRSQPAEPATPAVRSAAGRAPGGAALALAASGAEAARPARHGAPELLLAAARELAANRAERARAALDQALAADPSEPAGHVLDGFLHDLGGRAEEAAASYRAALYLDPSLFQPRVLLADCLLRLGQRDRAEHQFREVLAALASGRARPLAIFDDLPLPDRERALRRCRQALQAS
jgi:chemotaxis protein methyltransferase CheR